MMGFGGPLVGPLAPILPRAMHEPFNGVRTETWNDLEP
jgi:hypothetical protein